jgi:ssDNA-binding Zn-finger/Zn-ribbon topoisomerase 1
LNVQGEFTLKPQTIRQSSNHIDSKYNYLKPSKRQHDFSLVLSKHEFTVVVACTDYPKCNDTITIFGLRD